MAAARGLSGGHGASGVSQVPARNPLVPPPFLVERWDGWNAQKRPGSEMKVLSNSDCEPLFLRELLAMADDEMRRSWEDMSLAYTHAQGCPVLRRDIAGQMLSRIHEHPWPLAITPEHVNVVVPAEGIFLATTALLEPGDCVVCTMPGYQSLHQLAETAGCQVVPWMARKGSWLRESPKAAEGMRAPGRHAAPPPHSAAGEHSAPHPTHPRAPPAWRAPSTQISATKRSQNANEINANP